MKKVRVRYAPSPTGLLHIGNARTAIFNFLFARHYGGDFIIRIEDTDVARNVEGGVESQLKNLKWLGINWDEGPDIEGPFKPYNQLARLQIYKDYAHELLNKGLAVKDYREGSNSYAIRMLSPKDATYEFNDMVRGTLVFKGEEVEDWIILKDNGIPTYNFAVVIDDHLMEITHVMRGEEHITNTPKQIMVYRAFGWEAPTFGHMTIIVNEQHKKLSKRDSSVIQFIEQYHELGYLPEALFNFICLLGWSPKTDEEILNQAEIISQFDETRLTKAPSMFDKAKLAYVNSRYIKEIDKSDFKDFCRPFLERAGIKIKNEDWLLELTSLFQDRMSYGAEIVKLYQEFFLNEFSLLQEKIDLLIENNSKPLINEIKLRLEKDDFSNPDTLFNIIKESGKSLGYKGKSLFMPIRVAITSEEHGPSLPHAMALLGKDKVIERLNITLEAL